MFAVLRLMAATAFKTPVLSPANATDFCLTIPELSVSLLFTLRPWHAAAYPNQGHLLQLAICHIPWSSAAICFSQDTDHWASHCLLLPDSSSSACLPSNMTHGDDDLCGTVNNKACSCRQSWQRSTAVYKLHDQQQLLCVILPGRQPHRKPASL